LIDTIVQWIDAGASGLMASPADERGLRDGLPGKNFSMNSPYQETTKAAARVARREGGVWPYLLTISVASAAFVIAVLLGTASYAQTKATSDAQRRADAAQPVEKLLSPIFGVAVPPGYRNWELVAPSHRPDFGEIRSVLGNDLAINAYRANTLPFPDGAILAKLAWKHVPSSEVGSAFVPGAATTLQVMVKDSKKYAATGGWGFGRFIDGKPVDAAQHQTCFACHQALVKNHDFVFTRLAR